MMRNGSHIGMVTLFAWRFSINVLIAENRKKKDIGKDVYHQRID